MTAPTIMPSMDPTRPPRRAPAGLSNGLAMDPTPGPNIGPGNPGAGGGLAAKAFGSGYSPTAGVAQTKIDPTNDLRSQQITPGYDPRQATAARQADTAASKVAGFNGYTPFQSVNTNDNYTSNAAGYTNQAAQAANQAPIAGTNTGPASDYLTAAQRTAGGGNVSYGGPNSIGYGADTTGLRSSLTDSIQGLSSAPDRSALAAQAFKLIQDQQAPIRAQQFRGVGQQAAALGRIGAGMTTNDLTGLAQDYTKQDNLTSRDLALQAAGQTLNDRLGIVGATQSGLGALAGLDTSQAGFQADAAGQRLGADQFNANQGLQRANLYRGLSGDALNIANTTRANAESDRAYGLDRGRYLSGLSDQAFSQGTGLRNENRADRTDRTALESADLNARRGVAGDLASREGQLFNQGAQNRNEFRTERGFQSDQAQQGINNAFQQRALEQTILGDQFQQDRQTMGDAYNYGWGYNPSATYGDAADAAQNQSDAAWNGVGSALGGIGQQLGMGGPAVGPGPQEIAANGVIDPNAVLGNYTPKVRNSTWYNGGK